MEKKPSEKEKAVYIDPKAIIDAGSHDIINSLMCKICYGVVQAPLECGSCESLFCEIEIK
jgi:hypothetical protein